MYESCQANSRLTPKRPVIISVDFVNQFFRRSTLVWVESITHEANAKRLSKTVGDRISSGKPVHPAPQRLFERARPVSHVRFRGLTRSFIRVSKHITNSTEITHQREGAMLQNTVTAACLRAANQLTSINGDFVMGWCIKADGAWRTFSGSAAFSSNTCTKRFERKQQRLADFAVAFNDAALCQWVLNGQRKAVGQLVGMEDSAPACGSANKLDALCREKRAVCLVSTLTIAERERWA